MYKKFRALVSIAVTSVYFRNQAKELNWEYRQKASDKAEQKRYNIYTSASFYKRIDRKWCFAKHDRNLDGQTTIIEDFVSLCNRQKWRSRKPRRTWENNTATSLSDNDTSDVDIKSECSESDTPLQYQFPLLWNLEKC